MPVDRLPLAAPRRRSSAAASWLRAPRAGARLAAVAMLSALFASASQGQDQLDLAEVEIGDQTLFRVYGSEGTGARGVPVAGGHDVDGDGRQDVAVAYMTADPFAREDAGSVYLVFGTGVVDGFLDSAVPEPGLLRIHGAAARENAGSEIWMDDVTGDGLGDLLICRQNFTLGNRCGAGALTIVPGGAALRTRAESFADIDLDAPPPGLGITTVIGRRGGARLCMWARTGDVDGDGVADIAVGSDQEEGDGEAHRGAVYVLKGGAHLAAETAYDLGTFGNLSHPLNGRLARILPPPGSDEFHTGGTVQVADLDANGRAEVLFAATLNRAGAGLLPDTTGGCIPVPTTHPNGGSDQGTLFIAWDDNFPASPSPWVDAFEFSIDSPPGTNTILEGEARNDSFGEEILAGLDYDGDTRADLFVGDLVADGTALGNRSFSGLAHMISDVSSLKGVVGTMSSPPPGLTFTRILGPSQGAISADTAIHGDFDADGAPDLAFSSPHADVFDRTEAGILHVLYGTEGTWPALIDLADADHGSNAPRRLDILGAEGESEAGDGDTLAYSGAAVDFDGDRHLDMVINEMVGDGFGGTPPDVGNLIVVSGKALDTTLLFADGFESGTADRWSTVR